MGNQKKETTTGIERTLHQYLFPYSRMSYERLMINEKNETAFQQR